MPNNNVRTYPSYKHHISGLTGQLHTVNALDSFGHCTSTSSV